jgi:membrane-associated protein
VIPSPDLASLAAVAVYAVVWGFLFAECGLLVGFLLPGDTILFGGGLVAASPNSQVNIVVLVIGAFVAAVAGNELGYATGKRFGRTWLEGRESGRGLAQLRRTETFYERYGWWSVVAARWVPWVRTFTPLVAGTAAMSRRAFLGANLVGALSWAVFLPLLGYVAYGYPVIRVVSFTVAVIAIAASLVGVVLVLLRGRRRPSGAPRDEHLPG